VHVIRREDLKIFGDAAHHGCVNGMAEWQNFFINKSVFGFFIDYRVTGADDTTAPLSSVRLIVYFPEASATAKTTWPVLESFC
jgi:hypothetical protein